MKKYIYFAVLLFLVSCSPNIKKINILEPEITLNPFDSTFLIVENTDGKKIELKSKNVFIAGIEDGCLVKALFSGETYIYVINKDNAGDIDSCKIVVPSLKETFPYQEPLFNLNTTISEVFEYEKENGFVPVIEKFSSNGSKEKLNYLHANRSVGGGSNKKIVYSFDKDDKVRAVFLAIPTYKIDGGFAQYFIKKGAPAATVGYGNMVFLLYNGESDDEYMEKLDLMKKGSYAHSKLKNSICLTVLMNGEMEFCLIAYHKAHDINNFPNYTSEAIFR